MVDRLSEWGLYEYRHIRQSFKGVICGNKIITTGNLSAFYSRENHQNYAREAGMRRLVHKELCGW